MQMRSHSVPTDSAERRKKGGERAIVWLRWASLAIGLAFYALHFLHLGADFPNNSPWSDWSKYTDEGWYSDGAVRHLLFGHWNFPGDFNPAIALPVWPLVESVAFRLTGVSMVAARALTVAVFGVTLVVLWVLLDRFPGPDRDRRGSLAAPLAVLLLCVSPFFFVFERMAILEPLLCALGALALLTASSLRSPPARSAGAAAWLRAILPSLALTILLPALVLTKPTAVALLPAVAYMIWARAGHRLRPALTLGLPPFLLGAAIWLAYFLLIVRPHFLVDYQYLFAANAYTGFQLDPLATVVFNTVADGHWMGEIAYPLFFVLMAILVFTRPLFFRNPLVPSLLLWVAGYFLFLGYHNNLQPRYYLVLATPVVALLAMALDELRQGPPAGARQLPGRLVPALRAVVVSACVLAIVVPDARLQLAFSLHPEYTFRDAARAIAAIVRADRTHPQLILSVSGSDITLMTGLRSIDDDFGTLDLDDRVRQYRPGWFIAWNELDDDKMDALQPAFHPVRVASFPALDDPERNLLILYRLDPGPAPRGRRRGRRPVPRPLRTRVGQQPSASQLQH